MWKKFAEFGRKFRVKGMERKLRLKFAKSFHTPCGSEWEFNLFRNPQENYLISKIKWNSRGK